MFRRLLNYLAPSDEILEQDKIFDAAYEAHKAEQFVVVEELLAGAALKRMAVQFKKVSSQIEAKLKSKTPLGYIRRRCKRKKSFYLV